MRLLRLWIFLLIAIFCTPQQTNPWWWTPATGSSGGGGGTGTFTLVQNPASTSCSAATTCAITLTQTTAAGNLLVFSGASGNTGTATSMIPLSIDKGGTLVNAISCTSATFSFLAYVLPSTSTAATTPITMTFTNGSATSMAIKMYELHPSANGSNVGLDNCNSVNNIVASTNPNSPAVTWSGTHDAESQLIITNTQTPSGIAAPCNNGTQFAAGGIGWGACPTPVSGASVAWTIPSDTSFTTVGSFGFNVSSFLNQSFNDFEAGTAGNVPLAADLNSSQHGWQGGIWALNLTKLVYDATASMPLIGSSGRLPDGVTYASGAGSKGLSITGDGVARFEVMEYDAKVAGQVALDQPNVAMSFKYNDNLDATDNATLVDCGTIHGTTDFAAANCYGDGVTRFFRLETPEGNGPNLNVTLATSCPCTVVIKYQAGNGTVAGTHEVDVYNSSGTLLGTSTHAGAVAVDYANNFQLGNSRSGTITTGKVVKFDSWQISLDGTVPNR